MAPRGRRLSRAREKVRVRGEESDDDPPLRVVPHRQFGPVYAHQSTGGPIPERLAPIDAVNCHRGVEARG